MFGRLIRRCFNTKPARRARVKLKNPAPITAGEPIVLDNGCTFIDLKAKATLSLPVDKLPLLKNMSGRFLDPKKIDEMKLFRAQDPTAWTVTQLSKKYHVSRSFVLTNVLTEDDRLKYANEIDAALAKMSTKQQKGWILRHKIRQDRELSL